MKQINRIINKNDFIVDFILSDLAEKLYLAEPETMVDKVNYVFINGFIDVGDLPCRKKFWQDVTNRQISLPPQIQWTYINYNSEETKIDSSSFWHRPHYLSRWAKTILVAPKTQNYQFRVSTCGSVFFWVNGKKVAEFSVYQRNKEALQEIILPLNEGQNEIIIFFDDIAERDTYFYFQLQFLGDETLYNLFSADNNEDKKIRFYGDFIRNIEIHSVNENVLLESKNKPKSDISLQCVFSKHPHEDDNKIYFSPIWEKNEEQLHLCKSAQLGSGFWYCHISYQIGSQKITKLINVTIAPEHVDDNTVGRSERFKAISLYLAQYGYPQIGKVLAAFEHGICNDEIIAIIEKSLKKISQRHDCSDFIMVPLLFIWKKHAGKYLSENMWKRIRSSILGWRYWIDEPGNDVMWFWSENHCLCFHAAQYLAGDIFFDLLFINSNRMGYENKKIAHKRLLKWFEQYEKNGFVEWNSIAYYPIDLIALLALYEDAADDDIRAKAKNALDNLFAMVAIHSLKGKAVGSMGRAYEKEILSADVNELSTYIHALWGHGVMNKSLASLPLLLAGRYQPPSYMDILANWKADTAFEARYFQGVNQQAKLITWKNKDAVLSNVVNHFTGQNGHQQHVIDLSFAGNPNARIWINHPGEKEPNGEARPSFWAGNGILPRVNQYRNRALMIMQHQNHDIAFSHLHFPKDAFDEVIYSEQSVFFRCQKGYGAIFASDPLIVNGDVLAENEIRLNKPQSAWYICVGDENQDGGFHNFVIQMQQNNLRFDGEKAYFDDPFIGPISLTWSGEFTHNHLHFIDDKWQNMPVLSLDTYPNIHFLMNKVEEHIR